MDEQIPQDEDEQLRLAIALSLEQEHMPRNEDKQAISDENMPRADVEGAANRSNSYLKLSSTPSAQLADMKASEGQQSQGFLGLDRRAMEQERLARSRARKLPEVTAKRALDEEDVPQETSDHGPKRPRYQSTTTTLSSRSVANASSPGGFEKVPSSPLQYPDGTIKQTWCFGYARSPNDIKLEEVLQKNSLQLAVLSSFIWDVDWVLSKLQSHTKVVMVMHAKDDTTREQYVRESKQITGHQVRLCFPPMPGNTNCMHSKLMLLAHADYLRIVVPTANLVPFDWGESGVMENMAFIIDLPRRADGRSLPQEQLTLFGQDLWHFCTAMGLSEDTVRSIGKFDFAATAKMAFVHTIGGDHREEASWRRTGYPGLGRAVSNLGLQSRAKIQVHYVASSIGALSCDFLQMLYTACKGDDGLTEYHRRTAPKSKAAAAQKLGDQQAKMDEATIREQFMIYFPSEEAVLRSRGGPGNAGTICFQPRWYDAPDFPKGQMLDCRSRREGLLMHNKLILVQELPPLPASTPGDNDRSPKAWAYIGSANCSESAWGRLVRDRTTKQPKLGCRNWECGIVLPISNGDTNDKSPGLERGLARFARAMPLPMQVPARKLVDEDLRPWFFAAT